MPQELKTLLDYCRWGASEFERAALYFGHGTDNALDEAAAIILHCLALPDDLPEAYWQCRLTGEEADQITSLIQKRIATRKPLPYLTGRAWFCGLEFFVNEHVLIPRSPIAELIEEGFLPWVDTDRMSSVLELCTGSGCIATAMAVYHGNWRIWASDISEKALAVAQENISRHGVNEQIQLLQSDLFKDISKESKFDLIIANPPYVSRTQIEAMPDEYRVEPVLALAAGEDGMDLILKIMSQALFYLREGGVLIAEVGVNGSVLQDMLPSVPFTWVDFERPVEKGFLS